MTNRERTLAVLKGEKPDRIPFTTCDWKIPCGENKRRLVERGLVPMRSYPRFRMEHPRCEWRMTTYIEDGVKYEREFVRSPKGEVTALFVPGQTCNVRKQIEYWIKGEKDCGPLMFMARNTVFRPAYEEAVEAREDLGQDWFVWLWAGYSPLQEIAL
jgi:hypothetical protein